MILTLHLDEASQAYFDTLRRRYFPSDRNLIAAHLTMFHALPDATDVADEIAAAAMDQGPFAIEVDGVRSLGRGVAYRMTSSTLAALHRRLAAAFDSHLIAQDRQRFEPHIVVQNKVTPAEARALLAELSAARNQREVMAEGLDLWHYLGGPWEHARSFPFTASP